LVAGEAANDESAVLVLLVKSLEASVLVESQYMVRTATQERMMR
jgi:Na+-transporting NADH:ubiquinone oxidoreductase subunit NqrC